MTRNGAPTPRFTPHCILAVRGEPSDIVASKSVPLMGTKRSKLDEGAGEETAAGGRKFRRKK